MHNLEAYLELVEDFNQLVAGEPPHRYCLFACFADGSPSVALCSVEREAGDILMSPHFVSPTTGMELEVAPEFPQTYYRGHALVPAWLTHHTPEKGRLREPTVVLVKRRSGGRPLPLFVLITPGMVLTDADGVAPTHDMSTGLPLH